MLFATLTGSICSGVSKSYFASMFKLDFPLTSLSWNCLFSANFIEYKYVEYEHYFVGTNVQKLYKPSASKSEKQVEFVINSSQIMIYAFIWLHPSSLISYEAKDPFICVRLSPQTNVPCYFCGHAWAPPECPSCCTCHPDTSSSPNPHNTIKADLNLKYLNRALSA